MKNILRHPTVILLVCLLLLFVILKTTYNNGFDNGYIAATECSDSFVGPVQEWIECN